MPIHELSRPIPKDGLWRVDGLGEVRATGHGLDIDVCLSEVFEIDETYNSRVGNTLKYTANIREVFKLVIGSYWSGRHRKGDPPRLRQRYRVNPHGVAPTRNPIFNDIEVLPIFYKYYYKTQENIDLIQNNLFYCLPVFDNQDVDFLILPAHEVFRFYIGVSDRLLRYALIDNAIEIVDWNQSTHKHHGTPTLVIKREMSFWERYVCARVLCSQQAKNAFTWPKRDLQIAGINNSPTPSNRTPSILTGYFPFLTQTSLTVAGIQFWIGKDKNRYKGVFVCEMQHCSYREDLSEVQIIKDFTGSNKAAGNSAQKPQTVSFNQYDDPDPADLPYADDFLPADKRRPRLTSITHLNRFVADTFNPDINNLDQPSGPSAKPKFVDDPQAKTGSDGDYSQDGAGVIGINEHLAPVSLPLRNLETFIKTKKVLEAVGCQVSSVFINSKKHKINQYAVTSFPKPERISTRWHMIEKYNRRVAILRVQFPGTDKKQFIYILEMEIREKERTQCTSVIFKHDFQEISELDLKNYLQMTIDKKVWAHGNHKFSHSSLESISKKFFGKIKNVRINHLRKSDLITYQEKNISISKKWGERILETLKVNILELQNSLERNEQKE